MTSAASIWAKLLLDRTEYNKGLNDAKSQTKDFTKSGKTGLGQLDEAFKSVTGQSLSAVTAWGLAAVAIKKVVQELAECEQAAVESAKVDAKLNAVLESTGGVVGITSDELDRYATSLSKASGVDDELIKSAEAVMLTFTKIGQETFPGAMQAASDMAAVLGGDLQGKVTMIGKAMNDFTGYTALKRAGVSFTEEQIKQIANFKETNDLIGYQKLILGELSTEYGGAAKAINEAGDGQENLQIAWENYQEASGKGMITLKRQWNEFWTGIWEGATEARTKTDEYNDTLRELGLAATQYGWFVDGVKITKEQADAMIFAHNVAEVATDRFDKMAGAITSAGNAASLTEEQISEMNEANKTSISLVEQFTNITKLSAEEQYLATKKIILGLLEQKLAIDGLSEEETAFLLEKGVEWGVYSATAVAEMKKAESEASILAGYINNIPDAKNITITTIYRSLVEGGTAPTTAAQIAKGVAAGNIAPRANGGTTVAGGLYHVNELGMPEILTVNNQDYLMMGSQSGVVTPLSDATNSGNVSTSGGQSSYSAEMDWRRIARIIGEEVKMAVGR